MIGRLADNYGKEEWSTGTFMCGMLLSQWLFCSIDFFNTADRADQKIRRDLVDLSKALNKVLDGPKRTIKEKGQQDLLDTILEGHSNIIYQCIGLNDAERINQVLEFIKTLQ